MSEENKSRIAKLREQAEASKLSGPAKDDELVLAIEPIVTRLEKLLDAGEVQTGKQEAHFEIWGKRIEQATQSFTESSNDATTALENTVQTGINKFQAELNRSAAQANEAYRWLGLKFAAVMLAVAALVGMGLGIYMTSAHIEVLNNRVNYLQEKIDNLSEMVQQLTEERESGEGKGQGKGQKQAPAAKVQGNGKGK